MEIDILLLLAAQALNIFVSVTLTGDIDAWKFVKAWNDWY